MKKRSGRLNDLIQEAVDKAIKKHRLRGESIAISDEQGSVKVILASEILIIKRNNYDEQ